MVGTFRLAKVIGNIFLVVFFYATSICLTFYNKWMSKVYIFYYIYFFCIISVDGTSLKINSINHLLFFKSSSKNVRVQT